MYTFLVLSLFFLPLLHAERYQTPLKDQEDLFVPRSTALYYLLGQPVPRYPYPTLDQNVDQLALSGEPTAQRQRTKRIYWENLAFHAANFNQKAKKL